jgi:hypothetical protein
VKLLNAGYIREVFHPECLANLVLIKKKNKKWRICVHCTGLNKACPKDLFPFPRIDQVVVSTAGCETLYFLDAYSGYHKIAMCIADQLASSLFTPFGLRNPGATFQRCMRCVFGELIGCIIEAYVDNIIIKSKRTRDHVPDLTEVFVKLRQHGVKLNPKKCVFGVPRACSLALSCQNATLR